MKPNLRLSLIVAVLTASLLTGGAEEKPKVPKPASEAEAQEDNLKSAPSEVDPFAAGSGVARQEQALKVPAFRLKQTREALRIRLETWEVPNLEIARSLDHLPDSAALLKLRDEWLAGKEGIKLLWCPTQGLDASTRVSTESITEAIYPTEYEPPAGLPMEKRPEPTNAFDKAVSAAMRSSCPTAFETRNTGQTLEAVAHPTSVEKASWDVSLALEDVELAGMSSYGAEELSVKMPQFTSFRTGGLLRLKEGEWRLVSVMDPPRGISPTASGKQFVTLVRIDRTSP